MYKKTGAGKVTEDPKYKGPGMLKALLHNYDVEGDKPKPEHTDFLDGKAVPLLSGKSAQIWMQGSASRSGSSAYDLELSKRRVRHVADFLKTRGVMDKQMQLDAVGKALAMHHALEDESDRAVAFLILSVAKITRPPPREPPLTDDFQIRLLGSVSASIKVFGVDAMFFQIYDPHHNISAFYTLESGGFGKGFLKVPVSVTLKGDWNPMRTTRPIQVSDFGGPARFTTAGAGPLTWNYLNMMGLPPGVATIPASMRIKTGFTVGLGVSTSVGIMVMNPREVLPGKGID